jgi:hypothetical protein
MSSKRRLRRQKCNKQQFPNLQRAERVADIVGKRIGQNLSAYQCPFCHKYHFGHDGT